MARRKGLTNNEVAHRWAHDPAGMDHGESRSMSFRDGTLYSYREPIAQHVENHDKSQRAVLHSIGQFSVTTSHHQTIARRASHHLTYFTVPIVYNPDHQYNMARYQRQYDDLVDTGTRLNINSWRDPERVKAQADTVLELGNSYAEFFGLDNCVVPASALAWAEIESRYARLKSPEADAKRVKSAAQREVLAEKKLQEVLERWANGENARHPHRHGRLEKAATTEQRDRRAAILAERMKENIDAWLAGENVHLPYGMEAPCLLRVRYGDEIETSWGARFPVGDAKRAFCMIEIVKARGETWHANAREQVKLGHYTVDHITGNGDVRAGCHLVLWPAIERVARELGLIGE